MPSAEFESAIPAIEERQNCALERTTTWVDSYILCAVNTSILIYRYYSSPSLILLKYDRVTFGSVRMSVLETTISCSTLKHLNSLHSEIHTCARGRTHKRRLSAHRCFYIPPVKYQRCSLAGSGIQE
jgi:hypothetical protein